MSRNRYRDADDETLIAACVEGDRWALDTFVRRFTRAIYFYVNTTLKRVRGTADPHLAEDIYQKVFTSLLADDRRRLAMYDSARGAQVATWLRVITIRITLNAVRRDRRQVTIDDQEAPVVLVDGGPDPFDRMLDKEREARRGQLSNLAEHLSESDRLLLDMIYVQKMSAGAIAAALQIKRPQVHVRKSRLVKRLRRRAEAAGLVEAV